MYFSHEPPSPRQKSVATRRRRLPWYTREKGPYHAWLTRCHSGAAPGELRVLCLFASVPFFSGFQRLAPPRATTFPPVPGELDVGPFLLPLRKSVRHLVTLHPPCANPRSKLHLRCSRWAPCPSPIAPRKQEALWEGGGNVGLASIDRNNKATLLFTAPYYTVKSYARVLFLRMVKLQDVS